MTIVSSDVLELLRLFLVVIFEGSEPLRLHPVASHLVKNLNLVKGSDEVVARRPLNLESHVGVVADIFGQPHC